jgi:excisionase family DNA binding protein
VAESRRSGSGEEAPMPLIKRKGRTLISTSEAAEMMGYRSSKSVKRLIDSGAVQGVRMRDGGKWLVYAAEIKAFVEKRVQQFRG